MSRKGRQFCLLCLGVQFLVLLGLAVRFYLPKRNSFLVELDWQQFHQQDEACDWLGRFGAEVEFSKIPSSNQALLLRGAARHWPAYSKISVDWLYHNTTPTHTPGTTIVSPNKTFVIFNNNSALIEASKDPEQALLLPSRLELMPLKEFIQKRTRVQEPMFYPAGEYYYHQAPVPKELAQGLMTTSAPLSCLNKTLKAMAAGKSDLGANPDGRSLILTGALMRLTDADTRHAAHYDAAATAMLQLQGIKDVVLLPPTQHNLTYPYEKGHLLYRRARVNITHPDLHQYPLAAGLTPIRITLYPGDFLIFPSFVPHMPEAITDSISISFRIKTLKHGHVKRSKPEVKLEQLSARNRLPYHGSAVT